MFCLADWVPSPWQSCSCGLPNPLLGVLNICIGITIIRNIIIIREQNFLCWHSALSLFGETALDWPFRTLKPRIISAWNIPYFIFLTRLLWKVRLPPCLISSLRSPHKSAWESSIHFSGQQPSFAFLSISSFLFFHFNPWQVSWVCEKGRVGAFLCYLFVFLVRNSGNPAVELFFSPSFSWNFVTFALSYPLAVLGFWAFKYGSSKML